MKKNSDAKTADTTQEMSVTSAGKELSESSKVKKKRESKRIAVLKKLQEAGIKTEDALKTLMPYDLKDFKFTFSEMNIVNELIMSVKENRLYSFLCEE